MLDQGLLLLLESLAWRCVGFLSTRCLSLLLSIFVEFFVRELATTGRVQAARRTASFPGEIHRLNLLVPDFPKFRLERLPHPPHPKNQPIQALPTRPTEGRIRIVIDAVRDGGGLGASGVKRDGRRVR